MMTIRYYGHSCFQLTTEDGVHIVTDPYQKVGYELPNGIIADIATVSHGHFDHNYVEAIQTQTVIADSAARTLKGVEIEGIDCYHDPLQGKLRGKNIIFKIQANGITFCHLGDLGEEISNELIQKIGVVDVLLLPIGGTYTIDAKQAKEYAEAIAPKVIIPMHFKPNGGTLDIATPEQFLSFYPIENVITQKGDLLLSQDNITKYKNKIIIMERSKQI